MAIFTPERREQVRYAARHPVTFLRGSDRPHEEIRPWEQAVHMLTGLLGLRTGFTWQDGWIFQNYFHMNPNAQATAGAVASLVDGATDPIIGGFMDSKNYPIRIQRWFMRLGMVMGPLLRILPILVVGLTDWQRVGLIIACRFLGDIFGTPGSIGGEKVFTHITGNVDQRYRIAWAWGLGQTVHEMLVPISEGLLGLRDILGWNPRTFILTGLGVLYLPMLFIDLGQSFVIQRLPDLERPPVQFTLSGFLKELRDCFWITRHNKYFWLDNFQALFGAANPTIAEGDFFRFSGVENLVNIGGARGETLMFIRNNVVSLPINILAPFGISIIKALGGPRNTQVLHETIGLVCGTARAAMGIHTFPRVMFHWTMETFIRTFGRVNQMAERINQLEMFDYVEWKTGRRSEGATIAINGIKSKMITNSVNEVAGRLFAYHVLGFRPELGVAGEIGPDGSVLPGQGERYMRYMPLLYLWLPLASNAVRLVARFLYRHPSELRDQVEADLAERRRLAEAEKARMAEERETVGVGFDE
ncbi:MAG: MFS transporter [Oscillospiraceae bacterium]|nr:MFS transporter [Oscillospiraceae bacterium]